MTTPQLIEGTIAEELAKHNMDATFSYRQAFRVGYNYRALLAQPSVAGQGYTHADILKAHTKGYELGMAQVDRGAPPAPGGDVVAPKPTQERNENFVPGVMHCAKCRFRLNRINLNVNVGTVTAGDNKTEPCPNGCGPLWPITWEQEAREGYAALEAMFERAYAAEQALAARPSSPVLQLVASKSGTKQGQDAAPAEQPQPAIDVWLESAAKDIYDCWANRTGWVPWVWHGNSLMQDEARRLARAARAKE